MSKARSSLPYCTKAIVLLQGFQRYVLTRGNFNWVSLKSTLSVTTEKPLQKRLN